MAGLPQQHPRNSGAGSLSLLDEPSLQVGMYRSVAMPQIVLERWLTILRIFKIHHTSELAASVKAQMWPVWFELPD